MNKKTHKNKRVMELRLLSRLKIVGYILCFFGGSWFFYAMTYSLPEAQSPLEELAFEESGFSPNQFTSEGVLNFFFVAILFILLGLLCLFFTHRHIKKRK